jgi:WD40 repeat protein
MKRLISSLLILCCFNLSSIFSQNQSLIIRQGHRDAINIVKYTPDGKNILSASDDMSIKMWDVKSGIDIKTFNGHTNSVTALVITKDGSKMISSDADGNIFVWDLNKPKEPILKIGGETGSISAITLFEDNKSFLTGGEDQTIRKWNLATGKLEQTITGLTSDIQAIGINPNQKTALVGGKKSNDIELVIINLENGEITDDALKNIAGAGAAKAYTMAVMGGFTAVSNIAKGNIGKDMLDVWVAGFSNIEFSKDGNSALVSQNITLPVMAAKGDEEKNGNTVISILEFENEGKKFAEVRRPKRWLLGYPNARAVYNSDQTKIIVNHKYSLRIYDMVTAVFPEGNAKESSNYEPPLLKEFVGSVAYLNSISISPDYKTVVSADDKRAIKLWDINTGRIFRDLKGFVNPTLTVTAMPDGKHILVGSKDRNLTQWDITTGRMVRNFDRASDVNSVDISDDGTMIVTSALNTSFIKVWNNQSGRLLKSILEKDRYFTWVKFGETTDDIYANSTNAASGLSLGILKAEEELKTYNRIDNKSKKVKDETVESLEDKYTSGGYRISWDNYKLTLRQSGGVYFEDVQGGLITDACFSKDQRYVITTNQQGEIAMYSIADKKKTVSMSLIGEFEYIAYTPDFYYTSSKNAAQAIAFRSENTVLPFEQLELRLNRPDILLSRIGYSETNLVASYKAAFEKRLKRLGLTEADINAKIEVPEVTIDLDDMPLATKASKLSFKAAAFDANYPIINMQVYVNDVPVYGVKGLDVSAAKGEKLSKDFNIELSAEINEVKVVATNSKGLESIPASFEIKYDKGFYKPNLYMATIGVSNYQQSDYNLAFAAKDAVEVASLLSQSSAYENIYSKVLTDDQATKENIIGLRSFIQQAGVDDVVVIFIAGHGVLDKSFNYYFATHNMDFNNPANGGLLYEELEKLLDAIPSRNKLVFMDTCHSGELDKDDVEDTNKKVVKSGKIAFRSAGDIVQLKESSFGLNNTLELSKTLFGDMKKGTGATIISAAGGTEFALEGVNSQNGLFTTCLMEGIVSRKADLDRNRTYSVSELMKYVSEQVTDLSNGQQVPTSREENIKNDFRVY